MGDLEIKDANQFEYLWKNNGVLGNGARMELNDALSVPNAPMLLPKVISNIVKEAQEPLLVGTSLLQRINFSFGQTITFTIRISSGPAIKLLMFSLREESNRTCDLSMYEWTFKYALIFIINSIFISFIN